jgi:hypothetical protein
MRYLSRERPFAHFLTANGYSPSVLWLSTERTRQISLYVPGLSGMRPTVSRFGSWETTRLSFLSTRWPTASRTSIRRKAGSSGSENHRLISVGGLVTVLSVPGTARTTAPCATATPLAASSNATASAALLMKALAVCLDRFTGQSPSNRRQRAGGMPPCSEPPSLSSSASGLPLLVRRRPFNRVVALAEESLQASPCCGGRPGRNTRDLRDAAILGRLSVSNRMWSFRIALVSLFPTWSVANGNKVACHGMGCAHVRRAHARRIGHRLSVSQ